MVLEVIEKKKGKKGPVVMWSTQEVVNICIINPSYPCCTMLVLLLPGAVRRRKRKLEVQFACITLFVRISIAACDLASGTRGSQCQRRSRSEKRTQRFAHHLFAANLHMLFVHVSLARRSQDHNRPDQNRHDAFVPETGEDRRDSVGRCG